MILDPLAILYILLGTVVIFMRGPMIFAPRASMALFDRLVASDTGVRGLGLVIANQYLDQVQSTAPAGDVQQQLGVGAHLSTCG